MSHDIYGCRLRPRYCEVHPQERYPCSVCFEERQQEEAQWVAEQQQRDHEWHGAECAEAVVAFLRFATTNLED